MVDPQPICNAIWHQETWRNRKNRGKGGKSSNDKQDIRFKHTQREKHTQRGWWYLHEDSVPNMAELGAAMEIEEEEEEREKEGRERETEGKGRGLVSRQLHSGGHQSTQSSQPGRPWLSDAQMVLSTSRYTVFPPRSNTLLSAKKNTLSGLAAKLWTLCRNRTPPKK